MLYKSLATNTLGTREWAELSKELDIYSHVELHFLPGDVKPQPFTVEEKSQPTAKTPTQAKDKRR